MLRPRDTPRGGGGSGHAVHPGRRGAGRARGRLDANGELLVTEYRFLTTWLLDAPRERAWEVIEDAVSWPEWWRGVVKVDELDAGGPGRVGARFAIEWRSRLPYPVGFEFTVEQVDPPCCMAGSAVGELQGQGVWRLYEDLGVTAVVYDWKVSTTKPWMNLLSPVARPVFEYNHDVVMRWGGEGLARRLGARLLAAG